MLPPAEVSIIDFAGAMLTNSGVPDLPDEYRAFLMRSDGFTLGGVEMFGTKVSALAAGYKFPGIADMNGKPSERLRVGSLYLDSVYYIPGRGYSVVSDVSGEEAMSFDTFEEYLKWLSENIR
jgi:hypothetical protein